MEKSVKLNRSILYVGVVTTLLLMVPLVAMQFTDQVKWTIIDFVLMGVLLFGTGSLFVLVIRHGENIIYRAGMAVAVGATFLMIWVNLAVGLIGSGPHAGNLMYIGVVLILFIGIYLSRFKANKLELVMFTTALSFILITIIALLTNMQEYPGSSVIEIIGVNLFFATPYLLAGLLFRFVAMQEEEAAKTNK